MSRAACQTCDWEGLEGDVLLVCSLCAVVLDEDGYCESCDSDSGEDSCPACGSDDVNHFEPA